MRPTQSLQFVCLRQFGGFPDSHTGEGFEPRFPHIPTLQSPFPSHHKVVKLPKLPQIFVFIPLFFTIHAFQTMKTQFKYQGIHCSANNSAHNFNSFHTNFFTCRLAPKMHMIAVGLLIKIVPFIVSLRTVAVAGCTDGFMRSMRQCFLPQEHDKIGTLHFHDLSHSTLCQTFIQHK